MPRDATNEILKPQQTNQDVLKQDVPKVPTKTFLDAIAKARSSIAKRFSKTDREFKSDESVGNLTVENGNVGKNEAVQEALVRINEMADKINQGKGDLSALQDFVFYSTNTGVPKNMIKFILNAKGVSGIILEPKELPDIELAESYLRGLNLSWDDLKKKKILDIGANRGYFAREARKHGVEVMSLDINPNREIPKDIPYFIADATNLPFSDNVYDMVVSNACIKEIDVMGGDTAKVIHEARRVLKPGGEFRFGPENLGERFDKYRNIEPTIQPKESVGGQVYYLLTKSS